MLKNTIVFPIQIHIFGQLQNLRTKCMYKGRLFVSLCHLWWHKFNFGQRCHQREETVPSHLFTCTVNLKKIIKVTASRAVVWTITDFDIATLMKVDRSDWKLKKDISIAQGQKRFKRSQHSSVEYQYLFIPEGSNCGIFVNQKFSN